MLPIDLPRTPDDFAGVSTIPVCPKLSQAVPSCPKLSQAVCRKLSEMRIHSLQYFWTFDWMKMMEMARVREQYEL